MPPSNSPHISNHHSTLPYIFVILWLLLRRISTTARRVVVVHDVLMAYVVQDTITIPNAESYTFNPVSAFASFFGVRQLKGQVEEEPEGLPSIEGCNTSEMLELFDLQFNFLKFREGNIYNSCKSIEGTYIDLQAKNQEQQIWAIGPLSAATFCEIRSSTSQNKCLDWLNKQASKLVIYVSFGTTSSMANEQIEELAVGLEKSEQKFIWVLRDADRGDIFAADDGRRTQLPEGYEERVKKFGMVVRDWAPQVEILHDPSIEKHSCNVVSIHLIRRGISPSYKTWLYHGESVPTDQSCVPNNENCDDVESIRDEVPGEVVEDDDQLPEMLEQIYMGGLVDDDINELPNSMGCGSHGWWWFAADLVFVSCRVAFAWGSSSCSNWCDATKSKLICSSIKHGTLRCLKD
ncbi:Glycosyltransferase [Sarracenia purpurea var. burkii]